MFKNKSLALIVVLGIAAAIGAVQAQEALWSRTQKMFLSAGLDYSVYGENKALVIFGRMNAAKVYQVLKATDLLNAAKVAGYDRLNFKNGGTELWSFDLSAGVPECDVQRKICL